MELGWHETPAPTGCALSRALEHDTTAWPSRGGNAACIVARPLEGAAAALSEFEQASPSDGGGGAPATMHASCMTGARLRPCAMRT